MKILMMPVCPACGSRDTASHGHYETVHNGTRGLRACTTGGEDFSETTGASMQDIKTPISKVAAALRWRGEGLGLRATARILGAHKKTIQLSEGLETWNGKGNGKGNGRRRASQGVSGGSGTPGDELFTGTDRRHHPIALDRNTKGVEFVGLARAQFRLSSHDRSTAAPFCVYPGKLIQKSISKFPQVMFGNRSPTIPQWE